MNASPPPPPSSSPHHVNLVFLKLGGSLITDKNKTSTARPKILARLAQEINQARQANPDLKLVLGHGSGSFGHKAAKKYGTRDGVSTAEEWQGFAEVWFQASALNRIVVEAFHQAGIPIVSFPVSSSAISQSGKPITWDLTPIKTALEKGLLPLVYGDVVFDTKLGGTIFSTEDIFNHLARHLKPKRILLAGIEPGVWSDYPTCTQIIKSITTKNIGDITDSLSGSASTDVTGGMAAKVTEMLALTQEIPSLKISIFSGKESGIVTKALAGETLGTTLKKG